MKPTRGTLRATFERVGFVPNETQWPAYEYMLAHRLALVAGVMGDGEVGEGVEHLPHLSFETESAPGCTFDGWSFQARHAAPAHDIRERGGRVAEALLQEG